MKNFVQLAAVMAILLPSQSIAAEISTHVLDLARGLGGENIPVTLMKKSADQTWEELARAKTDKNGRVQSFLQDADYSSGLYKLVFDMQSYEHSMPAPFFPAISVVFDVEGETPHYHVPVVVSPYGYSTYRGN